MEYIIKRLFADGKVLVFGKTRNINIANEIISALADAYKGEIFFFEYHSIS